MATERLFKVLKVMPLTLYPLIMASKTLALMPSALIWDASFHGTLLKTSSCALATARNMTRTAKWSEDQLPSVLPSPMSPSRTTMESNLLPGLKQTSEPVLLHGGNDQDDVIYSWR